MQLTNHRNKERRFLNQPHTGKNDHNQYVRCQLGLLIRTQSWYLAPRVMLLRGRFKKVRCREFTNSLKKWHVQKWKSAISYPPKVPRKKNQSKSKDNHHCYASHLFHSPTPQWIEDNVYCYSMMNVLCDSKVSWKGWSTPPDIYWELSRNFLTIMCCWVDDKNSAFNIAFETTIVVAGFAAFTCNYNKTWVSQSVIHLETSSRKKQKEQHPQTNETFSSWSVKCSPKHGHLIPRQFRTIGFCLKPPRLGRLAYSIICTQRHPLHIYILQI